MTPQEATSEQVRSAWLNEIQIENNCQLVRQAGHACHPDKCGCELEMQGIIDRFTSEHH